MMIDQDHMGRPILRFPTNGGPNDPTCLGLGYLEREQNDIGAQHQVTKKLG